MKDITISKTYKAEQIWESVVGCDFAYLNSWVSNIQMDSWKYPCDITLTHDTKEGGEYKTTTITPDQLGQAFAKACADGFVHCSGYELSDLENADACTADLVIQMALFDDIIFG